MTEIGSMVMGATLFKTDRGMGKPPHQRKDSFDFNQKFFRPSSDPALNNRFQQYDFFLPFYNKKYKDIVLPKSLMQTPRDTIINYFSVLREAASFLPNLYGGCGTVGEANIPYPIAYNFFTRNFQQSTDYDTFYRSFQNIGHINLIKMRKTTSQRGRLRYFIELETIEGSDKGVTYFAYYYGFMFLQNEDGQYKIDNFKLAGEDFLCAPYHGWSHDAEMIIQAKYGNWCHLVRKQYPVFQQGDTKHIYFDGTDGYSYLIVFVEITNGYDIEIAQYRTDECGNWHPITLNPSDCLKKPGKPKGQVPWFI